MRRRICVWRGVRSDIFACLFIYTATVIISRSASAARGGSVPAPASQMCPRITVAVSAAVLHAHVFNQLSRTEDKTCLELHSRGKFDAVARCERRRNLLTGVGSVIRDIPNQQPKGDVYEVRERCEGGGGRGIGGWTGRVYGPEAPPGGSGRSEGSAGQGAR